MPRTYEQYADINFSIYPENPKVGDYLTCLMKLTNIHSLGTVVKEYSFSGSLNDWQLTSGDEDSYFISIWGYARLSVESVGTSTEFPYIKSPTIYTLKESGQYQVKIEYELIYGDCILTKVEFGDTTLSVNEDLSAYDGEIIIDLGEFIGEDSELTLYFDGTSVFYLLIDSLEIKQTDYVETSEGQRTMNLLSTWFAYDPYNENRLIYKDDRHQCDHINVIPGGTTPQTLLCWNSMTGSIRRTPQLPINNNHPPGSYYFYFWDYLENIEMYYNFCVADEGFNQVFFFLEFQILDGGTIYSTGDWLGYSFNVGETTGEVGHPNLKLSSNLIGSKVIPRGKNIKIKQIAENNGSINLEKLQMNVRPESENLIYVPGDIDWTKERGGS